METYKCRICGDTFLGRDIPSNCPFCGAAKVYIVFAGDWSNWEEEESLELSEVSKANLEHALMIENNSMLFYQCSCEVSVDNELSAMFEALAGIEARHLSIIREILGLPKPAEVEDNRGRCHALEQANIKDALDREKRTMNFYGQAAGVAVEPRVKEVFMALAEVEESHIELIEKAIEAFSALPNSAVI